MNACQVISLSVTLEHMLFFYASYINTDLREYQAKQLF